MNRRNLIKAGLSTIIGSTLAMAQQSLAAEIQIDLIAEAYTKTLVDGSTISAWRFRDVAGSSLHQLSANLKLSAGDNLTINLQNNLDLSLQLTIPGANLAGQACLPGESQSYTLNALGAGSYLICTVDPLTRLMGLACPLEVSPSNGNRLRENGSPYDLSYTLVLQDSDPALHLNQGQNFPLSSYHAKFFFINGLSFPETSQNQYRIRGRLGQVLALRLINAGSIAYPMHLHGYHAMVDSRNRQVETAVVDKDTVLVAPLECVDLLLPLNQTGIFPMHSHYLPSVTNNGIYTGGCVAIMETTV